MTSVSTGTSRSLHAMFTSSGLAVSPFLVTTAGKTFVTGLAMQFSDRYDPMFLEGHINKKDFHAILDQINEALLTFFPCPLCMCFGYCCCPCTLGLSFLCPYSCVRDAQIEL